MYKLSILVGDSWLEHSHPRIFQCGNSSSGASRVETCSPSGDSLIFQRLAQCLEPPYFLLYILHTPRGEAEAGRYQSPKLSADQFRDFIDKFGAFLAADSRFDIWAYSPAANATVAWDRHNLLFAYGPQESFITTLRALGFGDGKPEVAIPHQHHYRKEMDGQASQLLAAYDWAYSPLREEDKQ